MKPIRIEVKSNLFERIGARQRKRLSAEIRKAAYDIEARAKNSMSSGSAGGAGQTRRRSRRNRTVWHFASPEGKPPAVDTGNLKNSIQARKRGELEWSVDVGAEYGVYLEYGTRAMDERPFMRPAVEQVEQAFVEGCKQALASE
jgi:HK97 gp10 family phage protein